MAVDVDNGFEPYYVVDADKKKVVAELRKRLKDADELLLATDEDREGEAIAWHLLEVLKPKVPVRRMVFHEITKGAIERALEETREIDERLVDAQETRRILDRLYGYEVSPVLWKKITRGLSAGRVQSVATRLVVERERARMAFVAAVVLGRPRHVRAGLVRRAARRRRRRAASRQGRDFGSDGKRARGRARARRGARARARAAPRGRAVRRPLGRREAVHAPAGGAVHDLDAAAGGEPQAPLLLADGDARRAAAVRERLHHLHAHGLGVPVRDRARRRARAGRASSTAPSTVPAAPRRYARKVKNAQEAHEAIRPAGDTFRTPEQVAGELSRDELAPLRPDLEADDRVADEGRRRPDGLDPPRRRRRRTATTPSSRRPAP